MKRPLFVLAASAVVVALAAQVGLPAALNGHANKLKDAQSLAARVVVNQVGGAPVTFEIKYGKPNLVRIDGPKHLVVSDGAAITVLDKTTNTYTQSPYDKAGAIVEATRLGTWGWASFLEGDPSKLFKSAKTGAARKLRGADVVEVEVALPDGKTTATMYIEAKTGVARGYQFNSEGAQYVVWAESVVLGATAPLASEFAFAAPIGAKKIEPGAVGEVNWAAVSTIFTRRCMPCHNAQSQFGTLDLSTFESVSTHRFVTKGEAMNSILARALRAAGARRMPQGRPPLPETEIKTIEAWIDGGLKR